MPGLRWRGFQGQGMYAAPSISGSPGGDMSEERRAITFPVAWVRVVFVKGVVGCLAMNQSSCLYRRHHVLITASMMCCWSLRLYCWL